MKKYFTYLVQVWKNQFAAAAAYRTDFWLEIFLGIAWAFVSIGTMKIIFFHTPQLGGWTQGEIILLFLSFQLGVGISQAVGNHIRFLEPLIRTGRFDGIIIKPLDSQFVAVFSQPDLTEIVYVMAHITPYIYVLWTQNYPVTWTAIPVYVLMILCANTIWLAIKTSAVTLNFWWQRVDAIPYLLFNLMEIGKNPMSIYPKTLQRIFYSIFPVAFVGVVPADIFRGNISWYAVGGAVLITVVWFMLARFIWVRAIQNYSSASS